MQIPHHAKRAHLRGTPSFRYCTVANGRNTWRCARCTLSTSRADRPARKSPKPGKPARTRGNKCTGRIDVQHLFGRELVAVLLGMDAVHRTGVDAGRILGADTRFRDHISHKTVSPLNSLEWSNPGWSSNNDSIKNSRWVTSSLPDQVRRKL